MPFDDFSSSAPSKVATERPRGRVLRRVAALLSLALLLAALSASVYLLLDYRPVPAVAAQDVLALKRRFPLPIYAHAWLGALGAVSFLALALAPGARRGVRVFYAIAFLALAATWPLGNALAVPVFDPARPSATEPDLRRTYFAHGGLAVLALLAAAGAVLADVRDFGDGSAASCAKALDPD